MNTRFAQALLGLTVTAAIAPAIAFAHGKLEGALPAVGSTVSTVSSPLRMTFNEELEPAFSTARVTDANGNAISTEKAKVDSANPRVLTVAVPKLATGTYSVAWSVMTHDGHKVKGDYKFTVK
jgi:methionine-rich copper-binding protein CopC